MAVKLTEQQVRALVTAAVQRSAKFAFESLDEFQAEESCENEEYWREVGQVLDRLSTFVLLKFVPFEMKIQDCKAG